MSARRLFVVTILAAATVLAPAAAEAAPKKGMKLGSRTLRAGAAGKDVRALQRALRSLGLTVPTDGQYREPTVGAVRELETAQRWRVDGVVTRKDAKKILKLVARRRTVVIPNLYFHFQGTFPVVSVDAQRAGRATVSVVDTNTATAVQTFALSFNAAGRQDLGWNELTAAGVYAPDSTYQFQIDPGDAGASLVGGQIDPFLLRAHAFPVPGRHSFGGAGSRFGAGRSGHTHQGHDVAAACGERMLAAQGGTVIVRAYQAGGAGSYVVIRGLISGTDYVYMHLKKPSWTSPGTIVYTGQMIGKVGNTGASTGCHLHFERWSAPGWYDGGAPYDPLPELTAWDAYS